MSSEPSASIRSIVDHIERKKTISFSELASYFRYSRRTIFRKLSLVDYLTSYNKSGAGLTLRNIPNFNESGIWNHRDFFFTKWGTLKKAIPKIIDMSPDGLYARDLQDILMVRINNHLSMCVKEGLIQRNNDFGHPIYFSTNTEIRKLQYEQRKMLFQKKHPVAKNPLSGKNIIKVLVAIIKHHVTTADKLIPILEAKGVHLSKQSIKWVLKKYDIEKKGSP